jgi:hypothetical protein
MGRKYPITVSRFPLAGISPERSSIAIHLKLNRKIATYVA